MNYYCVCGWGQHREPKSAELTMGLLENAATHEALNDGITGKHTIYRSDGSMSVAEAEYIRGYKAGRRDALDSVRRLMHWILEPNTKNVSTG
jgi:hypothetical protein